MKEYNCIIKKIFLAIIFICSFIAAYCQSSADTIYWKNRNKLTWNDFKGTPKLYPSAMSTCGFTCFSFIRHDSLLFNISCYFNKTKSWVKKEDTSIGLLIHEQGHFNICEIYARKLSKILSLYTHYYNDVGYDVSQIIKEVSQQWDHYNDLYDKETNHSIDTANQRRWNKIINDSLMTQQ